MSTRRFRSDGSVRTISSLVVLLIVAGVGGWFGWNYWSSRQAEETVQPEPAPPPVTEAPASQPAAEPSPVPTAAAPTAAARTEPPPVARTSQPQEDRAPTTASPEPDAPSPRVERAAPTGDAAIAPARRRPPHGQPRGDAARRTLTPPPTRSMPAGTEDVSDRRGEFGAGRPRPEVVEEPPPAVATAESMPAQDPEGERVVFVRQGENRYHLDADCRLLRGPVPRRLSAAEAASSHRPCPICARGTEQ